MSNMGQAGNLSKTMEKKKKKNQHCSFSLKKISEKFCHFQ